jgi:predicted exporter
MVIEPRFAWLTRGNEGGFITLKSLALGWLLVVVVTIGLALRQGPAFDSSILSLLPESDQQPLVRAAIEQMSEDFSERLILVAAGENEQELRVAVASMAENLALMPDIAQVYWQVDKVDIARMRDQLYRYRFSVVDAGVRELLLAGAYQQISDRALARLYGPLSGAGSSVIEDPFGLYFENTVNRPDRLNVQVTNSLLKVTGTETPAYLMILTLNGDPFSTGLQQRVLAAIATQRSELSAAIDSVAMSGMLLHAAAGTRQAKSEISTIGSGSLIGIVIIMILVFRRFKPLLLMMVPVAIGCSFATAMVLLIFDEVHLVTFAFGAGLVGVSIDYALHYLCARSVSPASQVLDEILPGLLLGLFSSVVAYAALALTPFPGLRQMAAFSVFGLCASWLTVVLWFPRLTRADRQYPLDAAAKLDTLRRHFPRLDSSPLLKLMLLVPVGLACMVTWNGDSQDDIRLLQTSPVSLLQQERALHQTLGISSSSRFLLISADTLEQCLQKEEQLVSHLQALRDDGIIGGYQALSSSLPSLRRQNENYELVRQLYQRQLGAFYSLIKASPAMLADALAVFEQSAQRRLDLEVWKRQIGSEALRGLLVEHSGSAAATVIQLTGELDSSAGPRLNELADSMIGVSYIDQLQNLSDLLGKYRILVGDWVLLAYLIVLIALLRRYKVRVWRILAPPLLASILTLAILLQFEPGINLFHLLAMILVLGIGLDMGIFLAETDEASHTWLAVSLSTVTSLLAFGLLALSDTPVLHHFGITVAIGLSLVWLMAPLMRKH